MYLLMHQPQRLLSNLSPSAVCHWARHTTIPDVLENERCLAVVPVVQHHAQHEDIGLGDAIQEAP
jgi:hypothetical protein